MRFIITREKDSGAIGSICVFSDLNPDDEHNGDYFVIDEIEINDNDFAMYGILEAIQRQATDKMEYPTITEKLVAAAFQSGMKWRS